MRLSTLLAQLFGIGLAAALAGPALPGMMAYLMSLNRRPLLAGTAFLLGAASVVPGVFVTRYDVW